MLLADFEMLVIGSEHNAGVARLEGAQGISVRQWVPSFLWKVFKVQAANVSERQVLPLQSAMLLGSETNQQRMKKYQQRAGKSP